MIMLAKHLLVAFYKVPEPVPGHINLRGIYISRGAAAAKITLSGCGMKSFEFGMRQMSLSMRQMMMVRIV